MQVSIQTDKKVKKSPFKSKAPEEIEEQKYDDIDPSAEAIKQRKIKRLTMINRELIEKLKQQNEDLTKKISKQKFKTNGRSTSVKSSAPKIKENDGTKRELMNAYKQIDMYKSVLTTLKAKQISIDSLEKINQLENKIKYEEGVIDQLQKEIKYLSNIKNQQQKQLSIYENDDVKHSVGELQKQVTTLKQRLKALKKYSQKREEADKKQQAYQIQLERALRKLNDQYYPGKNKKETHEKEEEYHDISEREWQTVKAQLAQLRKVHQENGKKIDNLTRLKNRQLKSAEENELKLKQKSRKLHTLKNKLQELTKLVKVRESHHKKKEDGENNEEKEDENKNFHKDKIAQNSRQVKKWIIPQGYCLQQGKIMHDSIFFSDKTVLSQTKKTKILEIQVWSDRDEIPNLVQFYYQDQKKKRIDGIQPVPYPNQSLEMSVFKMKEGDYLHKVRGRFFEGELLAIHFISKFGRQMKFEGELAQSQGEPFQFEPRPNQIPSTVFGAYIRKGNDEYRMCHLGIQFITDW